MLEFKSKKMAMKDNQTIFVVNNDKDRKRSGNKKGFEDMYPKVKIDGNVYDTKNIECLNISFVEHDTPIGIVV